MADFASFAIKLSEATDDRVLDRWAESLSETIATQAIHLARHFNRIPMDIRPEYLEALGQALDRLPEDFTITVSLSLRKMLESLPNDVAQRVSVHVVNAEG